MCDDVIDPFSCQRAVGWGGAFSCVHLSEDYGGTVEVCLVGVVVGVTVVQGNVFSDDEGY